jgi:hypothetical protein
MTTTQNPPAGASDAAIAQAFRDYQTNWPGDADTGMAGWIERRAAEIDSLTSKAEGADKHWEESAIKEGTYTPPAQVAGSGMGDGERTRFERWAVRRHGLSIEKWADSGEYKYHDTRNWWQCWQEALAAQPAPVVGGAACWVKPGLLDACTIIDSAVPHHRVLIAMTEREPFTVPLYTHASLSARPAVEGDSFQSRVAPWMQECFGAAIASDVRERGDRFLEESLELLQSHGYDRERVATLVDYVYGRPVGEPAQEVGGVMVTLAAYCLATGLDMHAAGETELARIWTKVPQIRAKQESKRGLHTPLPVAVEGAQGASGGGDVIRREDTIFIGQTRHFGDEWFRELTLDGVKFLAPLDEQQHARHLLATKNPILPKDTPPPATGSGGEAP